MNCASFSLVGARCAQSKCCEVDIRPKKTNLLFDWSSSIFRYKINFGFGAIERGLDNPKVIKRSQKRS